MLPMQTVRLQLGELLAADPTTLAPAANANEIALVSAAFTPSENMVIGDLTLASFVGSTPIVGATGAQQAGIDPVTSEQVITILAPAGGWRWECTTAPGTPQTVYGFALTTHLGAVLLAVALLPTPVVISAVGDFVDLGAITMRIVLQPIS